MVQLISSNIPLVTSSKPSRVLELDGLRGISVAVILLFHFGVESLAGGYIGVDVFFVLSGYLITANILAELDRGTFSVTRFYVRRSKRLLPAFFVTLAGTLLLAIFLMSPEHLERLARSTVFAGLSIANFFFLGEAGYFDTSSAFKPLLHFWSLAVEEQFYFVWPGLLLLLWHASKQNIFFVLLLLGVMSLVACELLLRTSPDAAFFMMPLRAYEFALGALCLPLQERVAAHPKRFFRGTLSVVGLGSILVSCLLFDEHTRFPGFTALLPAGGAALIIISNGAGIVGTLLRMRPIVALGTISYSVYLVHWPVVTLYAYWMARPPTIVDTPGLLACSLVLGTLLYYGVELRFRELPNNGTKNVSAIDKHTITGAEQTSLENGSKRNHQSMPAFFLGLALFASSIFAAAVVIWYDDGMSWRLGPMSDVDVVAERSFDCRPPTQSIDVGKFCRLGAKESSKARMLVIGDSHVEHLRAGFDALGKRNGFSIDFWTSPGCPPLRGTYKAFATEDFGKENACQKLGPQWESLVDSGTYEVVAFGARWMWMFEPENYSTLRVSRELLVDRDDPVMRTDAARELFNTRIHHTIDSIHTTGAKAVVFSQVPLLAKNTQGCDRMPSLLYSASRTAERCGSGVSRDDALARLRHSDETISALGDSYTLAVVFSDLLCPDNETNTCLSFTSGRSLYNDNNHLSGYGSHYVTEWLEPDLIEFLDK